MSYCLISFWIITPTIQAKSRIFPRGDQASSIQYRYQEKKIIDSNFNKKILRNLIWFKYFFEMVIKLLFRFFYFNINPTGQGLLTKNLK